MTENKRFVYYEHKGADYILENPNEDLDFIEMLGDCLDSDEIVNRLNELYDENEQLTKELKVYRKLARCSNCEHHGYDWFSDGEEFEVCEKGNDVTERICEDWEEL